MTLWTYRKEAGAADTYRLLSREDNELWRLRTIWVRDEALAAEVASKMNGKEAQRGPDPDG